MFISLLISRSSVHILPPDILVDMKVTPENCPLILSPPLHCEKYRDFDVSIVENGVVVRIYDANFSGEMRRSDEITNADLKFCINVKTEVAALTKKSAKDIFKIIPD